IPHSQHSNKKPPPRRGLFVAVLAMRDGCGGESGSLRTSADLLLKPLHPLVAAVIEVRSLGEALLVVSASWLGDPCLSKGVLKVLAGHRHTMRNRLGRSCPDPIGGQALGG
ncbi:hypothetical protein, partial [Parasynechococcus sp.]|uniref:hypothetical protein n=1 Tax=Parasynechococcus sp. TaxID=3101203 RepID=UPI0037045E1A